MFNWYITMVAFTTVMLVGILIPTVASAATYYVAKDGLDTNTGSLESPFLTVQYAANVMTSGDTCYIREGIYREEINFANSGSYSAHMTLRPYGTENVTISGCDVVNDWLPHEGALSPFTLQAESYDGMQGIIVQGGFIGGCENNDWIKFNNVALGAECTLVTVNLGVPAQYAGQTVEFHLDSPSGTLIGSLVTKSTGSFYTFQEQKTMLAGGQGIHDLYCVFKGTSGIGAFDWFHFYPYDSQIRKASLNLFEDKLLEAESYDEMHGIIVQGGFIVGCENNDWIKFSNVDLGNGYAQMTARLGVPSQYAGQNVEIRLDSVSGLLIGKLVTASTGSFYDFEEQATPLTGGTGRHDVYLVFKGTSGIGCFDWFRIEYPMITQVFVDGKRINEARFPNQPTTVSMLDTSNWAPVTISSGGIAVVEGANRPDNYWQGSRFVAITGCKWVALFGRVASSTNNTLHLDNLSAQWSQAIYQSGGKCYILGGESELDYPGEWSSSANILSVWAPNTPDPAATQVEVRSRNIGMNLAGKSYIDIIGLNFKACTIKFGNADHCLVEDCSVRYPCAFFPWADGWTRRETDDPAKWVGTGVELSGTNNIMRNTYIAHSWGDGVSISGADNTLENCVVEDTDWSITDCASVNARGDRHLINNCTLRTSARSILVHRFLGDSTISFNDMYNAGIIACDLGITYTCSDDSPLTIIAYNWLHEVQNGSAIYLDNYSSHYGVHHNVIWRSDYGIQINSCNTDVDVFNNTMGEVGKAMVWGAMYGAPTDVNTWNNLSDRREFEGTNLQNNLTVTLDKFTDVTHGNYFSIGSSPAIDAGRIIDNITTGYSGTAPDIGAYEYGLTPWTAGANLTIPQFEDSVPSVPINVHGYVVSEGTIQLDWDEPSGLAQQYLVKYTYEVIGGSTVVDAVVTSTQTSKQISVAGVLCMFEFEVMSLSDQGNSPFARKICIKQLTNLLQAEDAYDRYGVDNHPTYIGSCDNNDWIQFKNIDFTPNYGYMRARLGVPAVYAGRTVEIHLDSISGTLIGSLTTTSTGDFLNFNQQTTSLTSTTGTHDVFFVFKGGWGVGAFDWFRFEN